MVTREEWAAREAEEEAAVLSLGAEIGGTLPTPSRWMRAIEPIESSVRRLRRDIESPLRVNVVFVVPGEVSARLGSAPNVPGITTGRFSRKHARLLVAAHVPADLPEPPRTPERVLAEILVIAIEEAVAFAVRRKIAADLPGLRSIASRVSREFAGVARRAGPSHPPQP